MELSCDLRQFADYVIEDHIVLTHENLKAENTEENPNNVAPGSSKLSRIDNGILLSVLQKQSWNVIRLRRKA